MYIRKIAAAAGFACGAALALAPLASADLTSVVTSTKDSEIALQNSIFELQAASASADVTKATAAGNYDTLTNLTKDAPHLIPGGTEVNGVVTVPFGDGATYGQVTPLETEIYGANPILAGISSATGPYNELNGAITEFDNVYNVYAYASANGGALDTNAGDYLGSLTTNTAAVGGTGATLSSASQYFFNQGVGDLKGFDAIFAPSATSVGDIHPALANEIVQLNNLFELDGKLAGVYGEIAPNINSTQGTYVNFDSLNPTAMGVTAADLKAFDSLVFGAATVPAGELTSADVFNGSLAAFINAVNIEDYSLLNGGDLLPTADLLGTLVTDPGTTVSALAGDYFQLGLTELGGYFGSAL